MTDATETVVEKTEAAATQNQQGETPQQDSKVQAQAVDFPEAAESQDADTANSINVLLDMDVPVSVVIGQTEITVRKLLQLGPGSVIKLDKSVDAPADLYLRDTKFATGSVVVVDGQFAIRVKQILSLDDSAAKLAGA
jgi:flagellar motor switch protein FliN/FliY